MANKNMNQKTYSWNSEDYLKYSSVQYEWAQELIRKLYLNGDESVLDIGCGDGKMTALIGSYLKNGHITGIDSSPDMITLAQKTFPPLKYSNLSFVLLDATKLDFRNQFDIIFSNATLHWLNNAGLSPKRLELIPKDMIQKGKEGFSGWIRTTWIPYTERIPENKQDDFINDIINSYSKRFPIDDNGLFHIKMVRLEVEAVNPSG